MESKIDELLASRDSFDDFHRPTILKKEESKDAITGYLSKYSPAFFKSWQKRFVKLENHQLKYFKESTKDNWDQLAGVINFDFYMCAVSTKDNDPVFIISIHGLDRKFEFKCGSNDEKIHWFEIVQKQIASSKGVIEKISSPVLKEFWRNEQITEDQFLNQADTFDILLFQCNNTGAKITRVFTWSDFAVDHVAMILRFDIAGSEKKDVFLIESTGQLGVKVKRWSTSRQWLGNFYQRIVLRHLEFERNEENLVKLEGFLKQVNGKKYALRASQLINRKETIVSKKRDSTIADKDVIDEDRTFFCSELVAKAYKVCGIMQHTEEASANYLPVDFTSQSKKLKLVPGAHLSSEQSVQIPNKICETFVFQEDDQ